jgi:hypothetical protein
MQSVVLKPILRNREIIATPVVDEVQQQPRKLLDRVRDAIGSNTTPIRLRRHTYTKYRTKTAKRI